MIFFFAGRAQVFAREVFFDEFFHVGAGRFVGEIGRPEQAVVAEQLDIAFGRDFLAALKIKLLARQQFAR